MLPLRFAPVLLFAPLAVGCGLFAGPRYGEDECGDGRRGPTEPCDPSWAEDAPYCLPECLWSYCGDGVLGPDEVCDPALDPGCASTCVPLGCGNGRRDPREVCFDEVAPAVLAAGAPVRAFDLYDLEGDGDLDALLGTDDGVEVWLQDAGSFARFAALDAPGVVGVMALAQGTVARIEAVTAGPASEHLRFVPTLVGWAAPKRTPVEYPALGALRLGDYGLVLTETGWGQMDGDRWARLVEHPSRVVPWGAQEAPEPALWIVDDLYDDQRLSKLSLANENVPGFLAFTTDLDDDLVVIDLAGVERGDGTATLLGLCEGGEAFEIDADPEDGALVTRVAGPDDGNALVGASLDGTGGRVGEDAGPDDVVVLTDAGLVVYYDGWVGLGSNPHHVVVDLPVDEVRAADVDGDGLADVATRHADRAEVVIRFARP